ncbi:Elongation factor 1-delta 1 [Capsicum baccatum]|uniref:Elongation factor 1-delta 1 n=1 Tax=Capsicum baccatum TaxID=33114 RepID=A0A2G2WJ44_CAPBA|nr:Elongation factor 1-delta 1 [Capsicum baccatum]
MDFSWHIFGVYAPHSRVEREKEGVVETLFDERFGNQDALATAALAKEAAKPTDDYDDNDDIDFFGEDIEEVKKATDAKEASKVSTKKKESGKSFILMDVKTCDDDDDMKKLEKVVHSIKVEGLLWGASKLVPFGYRIKKKHIMLTIIDEIISVDTLIEKRLIVEPINEYVQSYDIVTFNKI